ETIPELGLHLKHKKEFTWTQDLLVLPDATPGKKSLPFSIHLQVCDVTCITGTLYFQVEFTVSDGPPVALTPQLQERMKVKTQGAKVVGARAAGPPKEAPNAAAATATPAPPPQGTPQDMGLIAFMLQGLLWGGIALFTPCVFPMIPITVSFFLK